MSLRSRKYVSEDDGTITRLPVARYVRMSPWFDHEPCLEWAGQRKKIVNLVVRFRDRKPVRVTAAWAEILEFDASGFQVERFHAEYWRPSSWQRKAVRDALAAEAGRALDATPTGPFRFPRSDPSRNPCPICADGETPFPSYEADRARWIHHGSARGVFVACTDDRWHKRRSRIPRRCPNPA